MKMMMLKKKWVVLMSWLFVLVWMVLIFNLSAQPATDSGKLSMGVTEHVAETVKKVDPTKEYNVDMLDHVVRKNAHFFIYLVLAILTIQALRISGTAVFKSIVLAIGISILYAISDEIHQLFVLGRGAQLRDVLIDSSGAVVGTCIYTIGEILLKRFIKHSFT
jgi:VanZ family protein